MKACYALQLAAGLVDVTGSGVLDGQHVVFVVRPIAWYNNSRTAPQVSIADVLTLAKVSQRNEVSRVRRRTRLVRHPHLHTGDGDASGHVGQRLHGSIVAVAEVLRQEEVTVLLVVGHINLERSELGAATRVDAFRCGVLL